MTRTTFLAALTVSALGSLAFTGAAEAGGLRLGFGGPMASFLAVPTHGRSSGYSDPSSYGGGHCAKKRAPSQVASYAHVAPRRAEGHQAEPKFARAEARPAHHETVKVASIAKETTAAKSVVTETAPVTVSDAATTTGTTGSMALTQTDMAAAKAETAAATADPAAETPVVVAETTTVAAAPALVTDEPGKDVGCKKFIPSVGVTVTVGCAK